MTEPTNAGQANQLDYAAARAFYRAEGLTLVNRPALPEDDDGTPAPRVDLARSGLIACEVPSSQFFWKTNEQVPCGALAALGPMPID